MVIFSTTSHEVLRNSLTVFTATGKAILDIDEFDTETRVVKKTDGSSELAYNFWFEVPSLDQADTLQSVLPLDVEPNLAYHVTVKVALTGKKGMVPGDTSQEHYLEIISIAQPLLLRCTNCDTKFLAYISKQRSILRPETHSLGDVFPVLTEVDTVALTCGHCGVSVSIFDPLP